MRPITRTRRPQIVTDHGESSLPMIIRRSRFIENLIGRAWLSAYAWSETRDDRRQSRVMCI